MTEHSKETQDLLKKKLIETGIPEEDAAYIAQHGYVASDGRSYVMDTTPGGVRFMRAAEEEEEVVAIIDDEEED